MLIIRRIWYPVQQNNETETNKNKQKIKNVKKYETLLTTIYVPELMTLAVALH